MAYLHMMQSAFGLCVRSIGFFRRIEYAQKVVSFIGVDFGRKSNAVCVAHYSKQPQLVVRVRAFLVLHVNGLRYVAQIGKTIVRRIAVDMIDPIFWPRPCYVKPCESVHSVANAVYFNSKISGAVWATCRSTYARFRATINSVSEQTRFWVITEQFTKVFCGKIVPSHVGLHMIGLVRTLCGAETLQGVRYFTTGEM